MRQTENQIGMYLRGMLNKVDTILDKKSQTSLYLLNEYFATHFSNNLKISYFRASKLKF